MNFILRNFFYGVGLTMLFLMSQLPAETAQFGDLVAFLRTDVFWKTVGCVAAILAGLDFALSGRPMSSARPPAVEQGAKGAKNVA